MTDLASARAARAKAAQQWAQQTAEFQTWRPTPTRAENDAKAASGDIVMYKDWDQSPIDPRALDALDPADPPPAPFWIPTIVGDAKVGQLLCALPGDVSPRRRFQWLRDEQPIPGANALRYTVTTADVGCLISFSATRMHQVATSRQIGPVRRPDSWGPP